MNDRLPYHARMMALFASGYDTNSARLIAADEYRQALESSNEVQKSEPPTGRLVGADRNG